MATSPRRVAPSPPAPPAGRVVALTGAASFLGRNLVGVLEEDPGVARIVAVDVEPPDTGGPRTRSFDIDLTAPSSEEELAAVLAAERVDTFLHLAFLSSPTHATAWAHELESVGTMHVLNAARRTPLRKFILWSQTILYGAHPENPNFLTERHPLRADPEQAFFGDKIAAEREVAAYAAKARGTVVTVLRTAPIVGPTVQNYVTRYLAERVILTLLGFDPLWQFVHEVDAIAAFKLAIDGDFPGVFNIAGEGVLPVSTVIELAGRVALPLFHPVAETLIAAAWAAQAAYAPPTFLRYLRYLCVAAWAAQAAYAPPTFLRYLRYLCVADGEKAAREMGFTPAYTTREALLDYLGAQRLRDAKLLQEQPG